MKILLIRPPVPKHTIGLKHIMICEPLELEYTAAGLKEHEVQIMDMIIEKDFRKRLEDFQPDIVGSTAYISGVNEVIKIFRNVKRWNAACLTVAGGVQAS
ncbi:MAG: cobalamin B12-binding domain-containing protein, partial [Cyclobacteriaceae bacterium]